MAYSMLAFNDPRLWGIGQDYDMGQALYQNWQRQLNEVMGFEDQIHKWNVQRDQDQLQQMAGTSGLAAQVAGNSADLLGLSDAMVGRAQALAAQRAAQVAQPQPVGATPIPEAQMRLLERLGLLDESSYAPDPYAGY
jgi:hypothetical protein